MIRNLIFDLGNVLISFKPSEYFERKDYPENIKNTILADIFGSPEWLMLDNGDLTLEQAIELIASKSSLKREEIAFIFNLRSDIMFPLDKNASLLPGLKKRGFRLYYLSNFPLDIFDEIKSGYFFFRYFDGGLISAEVRLSKPDPAIYAALLEKYSLLAEESLFIDDIEANVVSAEKSGLKGLVTYGSKDISSLLANAIDHSQ